MALYEIWTEGYKCTGNAGEPQSMGFGHGNSFEEACINFFNDDQNFDAKTLTYWGMRLSPYSEILIKRFLNL